jgi:ABC-type transport system involved in multi-copper enzyme maturation permease subunit
MRRMNEEDMIQQNEVIPLPPIEETIPGSFEDSQVPKEPEVQKSYTPKWYPIKSYLGIITIAKREFFANLISVRMLVLMLLFILAVLGGSYGISGLTAQPLADVDVLTWAIMEDYEGTGAYNDLVVIVTDGEGNRLSNVQVEYVNDDGRVVNVLFNSNTDSNGTVIINDEFSLVEINQNYFRITLGNTIYKNVRTVYALEISPKPAYVMAHSLDLDNDNIMDDALILVADENGLPISQANVIISSPVLTDFGVTDSEGLLSFRNLKAGEMTFDGPKPMNYDVEMTYSGSKSQNLFFIIMDDDSVGGIFDLEGPNEIIYLIAVIFIVMLGPIIAIALSFDSITKEKLQKSMDFLLARPMGRRGIVIGKFLGILLAIIIPVTAINLLAVGLISSVTNKSPDGAFIAGFVVYTIMFIAIYILLQQIFSTLAKTTGTAILSGIAVWLIFNLFWGLISLAIGAAMGLQMGSDAWLTMNNQLSLINPGGAYPLALAYLLPGQTEVIGVSSWMPPVAMLIWFVIMFFLATEIFVRKADS